MLACPRHIWYTRKVRFIFPRVRAKTMSKRNVMAPSQQTNRRRTAIVTLWSLLLSPGGLVGGSSLATLTAAPGQATTAAKPAPAPSASQPRKSPAAAPARDRRSMASGRGGSRRRAAPRSALYQPQVASWENQKHMTFYSAASYTAKAGDKPALGTIKAEADTKVSVTERLVEFSVLKITESNFPTLDKPQMQEIVAEITKGIPQHDRVIALDRVLASIDKSQILPKNVEGVKADPPTVFFSKTPAVDRQPRRGSDLESDRRHRLEVCDQHELGSVRARHVEDLLPAKRRDLAEDDESRPAPGRRPAPSRELQEDPGRRELERGQGRGSGQEAGAERDAKSVRQHDARGVDSAEG